MKREAYESRKPFAGEKKPGGKRMEACSSGQCLALNTLAKMICEG